MTHRRLYCLLPLLLPLAANGALAAAPEGLLNKTVTLSWTTSGMAKGPSGPADGFSNINVRTVYISSAGRTFLRMMVKSGRGKAARSGEHGPGEAGSRGSNRLIGVEPFASGARQWIATYDSGFSGCPLNVIDAKEGNAAIRRRGPNGAMYEVEGASTSSPTCTISAGDAFAGN
jgi:hypothetical protein